MATYSAALANGVTGTTGYGLFERITFSGTWAAGDEWSMSVNAAGTTYTIGAGRMTGVAPVFAMTLDNKLYLTAGATFYFSGTNSPTAWEQQDLSSGFVTTSNWYSTAELLTALANYQGKMLVISPNMVQIWAIDPDPANYSKSQTLPNIGTRAGLSVQAVGDMDVYMLAGSGVRSVRVRDASNNAIIADVGTPIDSIIQDALHGLSDADARAACACVDPSANRYWLHLGGVIYTFSYFPSSNIAAWGTYLPTYRDVDNTQKAFTPVKFAVLDQRIYVRDEDGVVWQYGGADNNTYDNCATRGDTPFLNAKTPATRKTYTGIDAICEGNWKVSLGTKPSDPNNVTVIYNGTDSSVERGLSLAAKQGTHFKVRMESSGEGYARFSSAIVHFQPGEEK